MEIENLVRPDETLNILPGILLVILQYLFSREGSEASVAKDVCALTMITLEGLTCLESSDKEC